MITNGHECEGLTKIRSFDEPNRLVKAGIWTRVQSAALVGLRASNSEYHTRICVKFYFSSNIPIYMWPD